MKRCLVFLTLLMSTIAGIAQKPAYQTGRPYVSLASATVSNVSLTANVATVTTTANIFAVGQTVSFSTVGTATWLNGQTVTLATGTNSTTLVFPFTHGNYSSAPDTGTTFNIGPGQSYQLQGQEYFITWASSSSGSVSAAVINYEGSLDNATWYLLATMGPADSQWSSGGEMQHIVNKGVNYVRMNVVSIAGGGAITQGSFSLYK